jgi:hypothetical protein
VRRREGWNRTTTSGMGVQVGSPLRSFHRPTSLGADPTHEKGRRVVYSAEPKLVLFGVPTHLHCDGTHKAADLRGCRAVESCSCGGWVPERLLAVVVLPLVAALGTIGRRGRNLRVDGLKSLRVELLFERYQGDMRARTTLFVFNATEPAKVRPLADVVRSARFPVSHTNHLRWAG